MAWRGPCFVLGIVFLLFWLCEGLEYLKRSKR